MGLNNTIAPCDVTISDTHVISPDTKRPCHRFFDSLTFPAFALSLE